MRWKQTECFSETHPGAPEGELLLGDSREMDLSRFAGQAQCVYLDPPYMTGDTFFYHCRIGREGWENDKRQLLLPAFEDRKERDNYLALLRAVLVQARDLLSDTGSLFLHLDSRANAYGRMLCDELFGEKNFVNEIIWSYQTGGRSTRHFSRKHDVILFYRKSPRQYFDITQVPVSRADNRRNHMKKQVDAAGRTFRTIRSNGKVYTYYDDEPAYPGDVWADVSHLQQKDPQRTGYETQKPRALLDRIILSTTRPGDLVVDLCCGSGTTAASAAALGRRFLVSDLSPAAVAVSEKRLIAHGLTLRTAYGVDGAQAEADMLPGIGLSDIHLTCYRAPDIPDEVTGLDTVERWSVGFLDGNGCFRSQNSFTRGKQTPEVPEVLQLPQFSGTPAMVITDILGRHSCWIPCEEEQ